MQLKEGKVKTVAGGGGGGGGGGVRCPIGCLAGVAGGGASVTGGEW